MQYFYGDIFECVNIENNNYQPTSWIIDKKELDYNVGHAQDNYMLVRRNVLLVKINEDEYYSSEYDKIFNLKPRKVHEQFVGNLTKMELEQKPNLRKRTHE